MLLVVRCNSLPSFSPMKTRTNMTSRHQRLALLLSDSQPSSLLFVRQPTTQPLPDSHLSLSLSCVAGRQDVVRVRARYPLTSRSAAASTALLPSSFSPQLDTLDQQDLTVKRQTEHHVGGTLADDPGGPLLHPVHTAHCVRPPARPLWPPHRHLALQELAQARLRTATRLFRQLLHQALVPSHAGRVQPADLERSRYDACQHPWLYCTLPSRL